MHFLFFRFVPVVAVLGGAAGPSWARGPSPEHLVWLLPLLLVGAGGALWGLTWGVHAVLPRGWPPAKRWSVAVVTAPSVFFLVILLLSGSGVLQEQLGHWLLP